MEWYEEEVSAIEQRLQKHPPPAGSVVFYGSSSMRMWDSLEADFADAGALNLAFGGSTMEACAWFFERLVVPCQPRSIICYAGDNDLGDGKKPEDVLASFRELLSKVDVYLPAIPFTILAIKPSPARLHLADRIIATNEAFRREILGRPNGYFIDIYPAMLGNYGQPDKNLFLEDGLHVSPNGYLVWKKLLQNRSSDIF
jgi:lysophospholipase L1-like esterase